MSTARRRADLALFQGTSFCQPSWLVSCLSFFPVRGLAAKPVFSGGLSISIMSHEFFLSLDHQCSISSL
jgi:hypothetical protein